jgi:S1-C subfamily serine protease
MGSLLLILGFSMALPAQEVSNSPEAKETPSSIGNSVVKVFSTMRYPDPYKPWTKQSPRESTGTGVVIEGNRILTNAHVVLYASQIQVQANQSGDKILASVEYAAPGIDLAVLKLDEPEFFEKHKPLPRSSSLPHIKDSVMAYGFPTGGSTMSITKGIVSRIEFVAYSSNTSGMRIQIDAAINPGNSGGPAVSGDTMIGLAYSRGAGENIGYIIPCEEIEFFLKDIADGRYDGKYQMFESMQTLENPALRAFLKVDKNVKGLVVQTLNSEIENNPLKEWDIITHIGDTPIDEDGMVKINDELRVRSWYLVQNTEKDGKLPLTVIRNQKEIHVEYPLSRAQARLVTHLEGEYPSYFIYGPIVFSKVTGNFTNPYREYGEQIINMLYYANSPLFTRLGDKQAFPGEEMVVVSSPYFPHRITKGYSNVAPSVLKSVNGISVKNLRHLVELLRDNKEKFVLFEFRGKGAENIVFERKEIESATEEVLGDNGIRSQGSPELMEIWNAKK